MAAANVKFFTFVNGVGRELQNSTSLEPIVKTISVSSNGSDNGTKITEVSGKFDFNSKKLANVAAGTASGEVLTFELIGANSGIAPLDSGGKVPLANLPNSIMEYKGTYDPTASAGAGSPALADGAGNTGDVYKVTVAGSHDFGSGSITFVVGDYVIYNGTVWEKAHSGADAVNSVNGFAGIVVLTTTDVAEGTNLYYTSGRFDTAFAAKTTSDLTEGSNLYFLDARAKTAAVVNSLAGSQTDQAPSVAAVNAALASVSSSTETFTNTEGAGMTARQIAFVSDFGETKLFSPELGALDDFTRVVAVKDATIADAAPGLYYVKGAKIMGFPSSTFTFGQPVYPSKTTPGDIQFDLTGYVSGDHVWLLGVADSDTSLLFDPQFQYTIG